MWSISEVENWCATRTQQNRHCCRVQLAFQITEVDEAIGNRLVQIYKLLQCPAKSLCTELVILNWQQHFTVGRLS